MSKRPCIVLLGAGGLSSEIFYLVKSVNLYSQLYFFDQDPMKKTLTIDSYTFDIQHDLTSLRRKHSELFFIVTVNHPQTKMDLVQLALQEDIQVAPAIISPTAHVYSKHLAPGSLISPGAIVSSNARIEEHVLLNFNACVAHDSTIAAYSSLNPNTAVSGHVKVGRACELGSACFIKQGLEIAEFSTIGACAAVVKSIGIPHRTWVGVPAKLLSK